MAAKDITLSVAHVVRMPRQPVFLIIAPRSDPTDLRIFKLLDWII